MSVLVVLIACSLALALAFLGAFLWSVRSGQYDDTHTPGIRILFDDEHLNGKSRDSAQE